MTAAATKGSVPPPGAGGAADAGRAVVLVEAAEVVVVLDALADDARKATIRYAEGARRRPPATVGVGKWLAGAPIVACSRTPPDDGLRP